MPNVLNEIHDRIKSDNEHFLISGLISLKTLLEAFKYEIDEDRKPLD